MYHWEFLIHFSANVLNIFTLLKTYTTPQRWIGKKFWCEKIMTIIKITDTQSINIGYFLRNKSG